jgi:hypothetical protein
MKEITPPRSQRSITTDSLPEFAATRDGVLKMPAPITTPRIIAVASKDERVFEGAFMKTTAFLLNGIASLLHLDGWTGLAITSIAILACINGLSISECLN